MSLQDQIAADQQAIQAAQAALDAANAQLAKDQAALEAVQPHLSVLAEIEQEAEKLAEDGKNVILGLTAKLRALF
jgi:hypothetical protein